MGSRATDVRGGFNQYIKTLQADGNTYTLTSILFDASVFTLFEEVPLEKVTPQLDEQNYQPSGATALYDGIGVALDTARRRFATKTKPYGTQKQLVVIMTDGEENASSHWRKEEIVARIKRRTDAGNWTFVYLMADQDAWAQAAGLGLSQGNVMTYTSHDYSGTFGHLARSTTASGGAVALASMDFFGGTTQDQNQPPAAVTVQPAKKARRGARQNPA